MSSSKPWTNLPDVPPDSCVVVPLRTVQAGLLGTNKVTYIGPAIQNELYNLPRSKWCNPEDNFAYGWHSLELYSEFYNSREDLQQDLPELIGQLLVCICDHEKHATCHGHELKRRLDIYVADRHRLMTSEDAPCIISGRDQTVFFKGSGTPLSNHFNCKLRDGAGNVFPSLTHWWGHLTAVKMGNKFLIDLLMNDIKSGEDAHQQVGKLVRRLHNKPWTKAEMVLKMIAMMGVKWSQCPEFYSFLQAAPEGTTFVEGTPNMMWGYGSDLCDIHHIHSYATCKGDNILGWIITAFCEAGRGQKNVCPPELTSLNFSQLKKDRLEKLGISECHDPDLWPRCFKGLDIIIDFMRQRQAEDDARLQILDSLNTNHWPPLSSSSAQKPSFAQMAASPTTTKTDDLNTMGSEEEEEEEEVNWADATDKI